MNTDEPVIIRATVEDMIGRTEDIEIPRSVWDAMTPAQRRAEIENIGDETVSNAGGWGVGILSGAPDSDLDDDAFTLPRAAPGAHLAALVSAVNVTPLVECSHAMYERPAADIAADLLAALAAQGWRLIHD